VNVENFSYVLVVAALGMAVVFLFLWFLSGLMTLIRRMFGERTTSGKVERKAAGADAHGSTDGGAQSEWILAAAVAFLEAEAADAKADPSAWVSGRESGTNPWIAATERQI
jgi:Na+-transporting methylmalonyl-CoA/oxaloacetate decarboxylase gamma subunit